MEMMRTRQEAIKVKQEVTQTESQTCELDTGTGEKHMKTRQTKHVMWNTEEA